MRNFFVPSLLATCLLVGGCAGLPVKSGELPDPPSEGSLTTSELVVSKPQVSSAADTAVVKLLRQAGQGEESGDVAKSIEINSSGSVPTFAGLAQPMPSLDVGEGEDVVTLDYDQVELRQVLEEIADAAGVSLVIDSAITGKVTMRTAPHSPLNHADLWPLLQLLLAESGIELVQHGGVYHTTSKGAALPGNIGFGGEVNMEEGGKVLQIMPLRHVSLQTIIPIISPLIEPQGKIVALDNLNILGVIAPPHLLVRINALLPLVDADPFSYRGIRLFTLDKAKAKEVAIDLENILKLIEGDKPAYNVLGLERINGVLVTAPPGRGFSEVERWLTILDTGSEDADEHLFIYRVKNLVATNLAATLNKAFEEKKQDQLRREKPGLDDKGKSKEADGTGQVAANDKDRKSPFPVPAKPASPPATGDKGVSADLHVNIVADEDTNSLLVRGTVKDYSQLLKTITALDRTPLEVMINIIIAEVSLTEENKFGVDWALLSKYAGNFVEGSVAGTAQGIAGVVRSFKGSYDATGYLDSDGLVLQGVGGDRIGALLSLVAKDSDLKVLSRPSILVRNNQKAEIKVGSEEPILTSVSNSNTTTAGNTNIQNDVQYRDTGILLAVTPHISDDGMIHIDVKQEISSVGSNRTVYSLPSFTSSKVETSAIVRDKSAIVLGGIIKSGGKFSRGGIPVLMDIPYLGGLFSTQTWSEDRQELVLIIVPELVDPQEDNHTLFMDFLGRMTKVAEILDDPLVEKIDRQ